MCWLRVLRRNSVNAFIICNKNNNHYQDLGGEEQSFWLVSKRYIIEFYMQFGLQIPKLKCVFYFHVNMKFNNAHLFYSCVVLIIHDVVFCICQAFPIIVIVYVPIKYLNLIFLPDTAPEMFYFLISTETTINAAYLFWQKKHCHTVILWNIYKKVLQHINAESLTLIN